MTDMQDKGVPKAAGGVVLVLGATGGAGGAVAAKLLVNGYRVRAMHRNAAANAIRTPDYDWVDGDAMNRDDVMRAAMGVDAIVHAVNPAGYRNWGKLVLPMIDNTIAAAEASGARILVPANVYNFAPETSGPIAEDSPQKPSTVKGRIRVEMEARLEAAARRGIQVILVRAGDFFGPGAGGSSWFAQAVVKPGQPVRAVTNPADPGVGHQWAYLPDVAETMVQLLARADELPAFARFHMNGVWDHDGEQLANAIRRVTGRPELRTKRFAWWQLQLARPFLPLAREVLEMRYLWQRELRMGNDRLVAFLGAEPHTPIDQAVGETLSSLGCLRPDPRKVSTVGPVSRGKPA